MRTVPVVLVLSGVVACTGGGSVAASAAPTRTAPTSVAPSATAASIAPLAPTAPAAPAQAPPCPTSYAQPDPRRPRVSAAITVANGVVTGTERIVFTPDLGISEVVLRLWAAAPRPAAGGSRIDISSTKVDGVAVTPRRSS